MKSLTVLMVLVLVVAIQYATAKPRKPVKSPENSSLSKDDSAVSDSGSSARSSEGSSGENSEGSSKGSSEGSSGGNSKGSSEGSSGGSSGGSSAGSSEGSSGGSSEGSSGGSSGGSSKGSSKRRSGGNSEGSSVGSSGGSSEGSSVVNSGGSSEGSFEGSSEGKSGGRSEAKSEGSSEGSLKSSGADEQKSVKEGASKAKSSGQAGASKAKSSGQAGASKAKSSGQAGGKKPKTSVKGGEEEPASLGEAGDPDTPTSPGKAGDPATPTSPEKADDPATPTSPGKAAGKAAGVPAGKNECVGQSRLNAPCGVDGNGICYYHPDMVETKAAGHQICYEGYCSDAPPSDVNATLTNFDGEDFFASTAGSEVTYTCNTGYATVDGDSYTITCVGGQWSEPPTSCMRDCGPLSDVSGLFVHGEVGRSTGQLDGDMVIVECADSYTAVGNLHVYCDGQSGAWTAGSDGECKLDCEEPSASVGFENAVPAGEDGGTLLGDIRLYKCNANYVGTSCLYVQCMANGQWEAGNPDDKCVIDCGVPAGDIFEHSSAVLTEDLTTTDGAERNYECNEGYTLVGQPQKATCTDQGGVGAWIPDSASGECVLDCGPLIVNNYFANAYATNYNSDVTTVGTVVLIACNADHALIGGAQTATCTDVGGVGTWTTAGGECTPVCTGTPADVPNAILLNNDMLTATYTCEDGSSVERSCVNGAWGDVNGFCIDADCSNEGPGTVANAGEPTVTGGTAMYTCSDGSTVTKTCVAGAWSAASGQCIEPVIEPVIEPEIEHATDCNGIAPGEVTGAFLTSYDAYTATYECFSNGDVSVTKTCNNGAWSSVSESCPAPAVCVDPYTGKADDNKFKRCGTCCIFPIEATSTYEQAIVHCNDSRSELVVFQDDVTGLSYDSEFECVRQRGDTVTGSNSFWVAGKYVSGGSWVGPSGANVFYGGPGAGLIENESCAIFVPDEPAGSVWGNDLCSKANRKQKAMCRLCD